MKVRVGLGITAAVLLLASALAHSFLGWPAMRSALESAGAGKELTGALAAGWSFGSVAMVVFGMIVLFSALAVRRGEKPRRLTPAVIALGYLGFGLSAYVLRGGNTHFLLFVGLGLLVAAFAWWPNR